MRSLNNFRINSILVNTYDLIIEAIFGPFIIMKLECIILDGTKWLDLQNSGTIFFFSIFQVSALFGGTNGSYQFKTT